MSSICDEESSQRSSEYLKNALRRLLNKFIEAVQKLPQRDCWVCGEGNTNTFRVYGHDVESHRDTQPAQPLRVPKQSRAPHPKPPQSTTESPLVSSTSGMVVSPQPSRQISQKTRKTSPTPSQAITSVSSIASFYSQNPQLEGAHLQPTTFSSTKALQKEDSEAILSKKQKTERVLKTEILQSPSDDLTRSSHCSSDDDEKETGMTSTKGVKLARKNNSANQLSAASSESEQQQAPQHGKRLSETDSDLILKMQHLRTRLEKFEDMHKRLEGQLSLNKPFVHQRTGTMANSTENMQYSEAIAPLILILPLQETDASDVSDSSESSITINIREINSSNIFKDSFSSLDSCEERFLQQDFQQMGSLISTGAEKKKILSCPSYTGGTKPISKSSKLKIFQNKNVLPENNINDRLNHSNKTQIHSMFKSPKHFAPNKKTLCEKRLKGFIWDLIEFSLPRRSEMFVDKNSDDNGKQMKNPTCSEETLFLENNEILANVTEEMIKQILTFNCDMNLNEKSDQLMLVLSQVIDPAAYEEFEPLIYALIHEVENLACQKCKSHKNILNQSCDCKDIESHPADILKQCEYLQSDTHKKEIGRESINNLHGHNIRIIPTGTIMNTDKRIPTQLPQDITKVMTFKQLQFHTELWLHEFKEYCELFNRQANFVIRNDLQLSVNREKIEFLYHMLEKCYIGINYLERLIREKESVENECLSTHCLYLNTEIQGIGDREILYKSILEMKHYLEESAVQIELINEYIKERFDHSPVLKITRILNCYANTLEAAEQKIQQLENELPKIKHLRNILLARKPIV